MILKIFQFIFKKLKFGGVNYDKIEINKFLLNKFENFSFKNK